MKIQKILQAHSKKITPERLQFSQWMEQKHLFNAKELCEAFPDIGRASVFRSINLFREIGFIRALNIGDNETHYEVECCASHHHEHLECQSCGGIISFESHDICQLIFARAEILGFKISEHSLRILGTCNTCNS